RGRGLRDDRQARGRGPRARRPRGASGRPRVRNRRGARAGGGSAHVSTPRSPRPRGFRLVTRGRPAIASWAETGRYSPPPKRERLRDLVQAGIAMRAGRCPPPLIATWLAEAIEQ